VAINARLLALVTAFDSVAADPEKLEAAAEVYKNLLSSVRGWRGGLGGDAGGWLLEGWRLLVAGEGEGEGVGESGLEPLLLCPGNPPTP